MQRNAVIFLLATWPVSGSATWVGMDVPWYIEIVPQLCLQQFQQLLSVRNPTHTSGSDVIWRNNYVLEQFVSLWSRISATESFILSSWTRGLAHSWWKAAGGIQTPCTVWRSGGLLRYCIMEYFVSSVILLLKQINKGKKPNNNANKAQICASCGM